MEDQKSIMQQVQEIGVEGLRTTVRGIVGKGPLVGFLFLALVAVAGYFEHEKRDFQQTIREQNARMDTLEVNMMACIITRMEQSIEINTLKGQVATLIANTRRKK